VFNGNNAQPTALTAEVAAYKTCKSAKTISSTGCRDLPLGSALFIAMVKTAITR
jgi:hypothetical protein